MFPLTTRKIARLATSHYVCLPPQWLRHFDLHKGDLLKISVDKENRLVVEAIEDNNANTATA